MMSTGFQWGVNNSNNKSNSSSLNGSGNNNHHQTHFSLKHQHNTPPRSQTESSLSSKKRRRVDEEDVNEDENVVEKHDAKLPGKSFSSHHNHHRKEFNFKSTSTTSTTHRTSTPATTAATLSSTKYKRSKTPRIIGQPLPPTRIIETLDKSDMTKLLYSLIDIHPELNQTITRISQPPSIQSILVILNTKFETIINSLPYKCDACSDYSYLRIKPNLVDFLNCLEDYILWILPPNQHDYDLVMSLWFLHELTNLIHKLPNFTNLEFQYTRNLTYETIINCWIILFNQDLANDAIYEIFQKKKKYPSDGRKAGEGEDEDDDELIEKLREHQSYCSKFGQLIEIYQEKLHQYKLAMNEQYNNGLGSDGAAAGAAGTVGTSTGGHHHHLNGDGTGGANTRLNEFVTVDYSQYSLNPFR